MDSGHGHSNDEFIGSSGTMPSAYLSPPLSWDNRRSSIASSGSPYCQSFAPSDYSVHTDYSVPVTPTYGPSPSAHDGFVDVLSCDLNHDFHGHVVHSLATIPQQKEYVHAEPLCEPFVMVHNPTINPLPYRPNGLPSSSALDAMMNSHSGELGLDVADASSSTEPAWDNFSTLVWPDTRSYQYHTVDNQVRAFPPVENRQSENLQMVWDADGMQSFDQRSTSSGTIVPSDAMTEDFVMINAESLDDTRPIEANESALSFPQTPQEVSFKKEESPLIKKEPDSDSGGRRFGERAYHRQTGAKSVKERRSGAGSKRPSKRTKKSSKAASDVFAYKVSKVSDGCFDFGDYQGKKREDGKWFRTDGCTERKQQCEKIMSDGSRCTKSFKRQEHMKRHLRTHLMINEAWCKICKKGFNRNDNCIAHYETHLAKPGGKPGRNRKMTLREMEEKMMDERADIKMIEKIREKCRAKHPEAAVDYDML